MTCERCDDNGVVTVAVAGPDYYGNYDTDEIRCPDCQDQEGPMTDTDDIPIPMLSTGEPSTLESYRKLTVAFFGEDSEPTRFIDEHIAKDPDGDQGVVIAHETQMIYLFVEMMKKERHDPAR